MERIVLDVFGGDPARKLLDAPPIPDRLVLGRYPADLDAVCKTVGDLLAAQRRPTNARFVILVTEDFRIIGGGATAPGMALLVKRYGPAHQVGRYANGCDIACIREDIEATARALAEPHRP